MRSRTIATGLGSLLLLLALVVGLPVALVTLGAAPTVVPAVSEMWAGLTGPDLSGRGAFVVLAALVWGCWGAFTVSVAREVAAAVRTRGQRPARVLPGLGWAARPAALLVAAVVAMVVASPVLSATAPPAAAAAGVSAAPPSLAVPATPAYPGGQARAPAGNAPTVAAAATASRTDAQAGTPAEPSGKPREYTVARRDTLWSIAERELGDPLRYPEIAALNPDLDASYRIRPGQVLRLPVGPSAPDGATVTVQAGDTFSELAADHGVRDWRTAWKANAGRAEPGGKRFTDPHHIEAGWRVTLPTPGAAPGTLSGAGEPAPPNGSTAPPATTPQPAVPRPDGDQGSARPEPPQSPAPASPPVLAAPAPAPPEPTPPGATPGPGAGASPFPPAVASGNGEQPAAEADRAGEGWNAARFAAGGLVVTGGVFTALVLGRRQQFRRRRPGRTLPAPGPGLLPVERATVTVGAPAAAHLARLDEVLRRTSATGVEPFPVTAVQLTGGAITVHVGAPTQLPPPWQAAADQTSGRVWTYPAGAPAAAAGPAPEDGAIAPFPTLVSLGSDATSSWLVDLEHAAGLVLTGDPDRCLALARVLGAQLALSPWADEVAVTLVGVGSELVAAAPHRLHYAEPDELPTVVTAAITRAEHTADLLAEHDVPIVRARRDALGEEIWAPQVLVVAAGLAQVDPVTGLLHEMHQRPGNTGTALVLVATPDEDWTDLGTTVHLDTTGQLTVPGIASTLTAEGWTEETSQGVAALLAHARIVGQEKIPDASGAQAWRAYSDAAGALREELVHPRRTLTVQGSDTPPAASCPLPLADDAYLAAAATTRDDLSALAPTVPAAVEPQVRAADPTLDADVAAWVDPASGTASLSLLGPLTLRVPGRRPDRVAVWAELVAYLATRENGATVDQVAEAFGIAHGTARKYVHVARDLLGTHPDTGEPYLPHATKSPAGRARGVGVYQVTGVLVDADLFRRLRLRGQARGPQGVEDYVRALSLVTGEPFSQMRVGGGAWLIDGDRLDFLLAHAVVDVAHLVVTHALAVGDLACARAAVEIARLAAPHEEIPRLDAAAVTAAEGQPDQARAILLDEVCNRSDDGQPPGELPERTRQILTRHREWLSRAS